MPDYPKFFEEQQHYVEFDSGTLTGDLSEFSARVGSIRVQTNSSQSEIFLSKVGSDLEVLDLVTLSFEEMEVVNRLTSDYLKGRKGSVLYKIAKEAKGKPYKDEAGKVIGKIFSTAVVGDHVSAMIENEHGESIQAVRYHASSH